MSGSHFTRILQYNVLLWRFLCAPTAHLVPFGVCFPKRLPNDSFTPCCCHGLLLQMPWWAVPFHGAVEKLWGASMDRTVNLALIQEYWWGNWLALCYIKTSRYIKWFLDGFVRCFSCFSSPYSPLFEKSPKICVADCSAKPWPKPGGLLCGGSTAAIPAAFDSQHGDHHWKAGSGHRTARNWDAAALILGQKSYPNIPASNQLG